MPKTPAQRALEKRIKRAKRYGKPYVIDGEVYVVDPTTGELVSSRIAYRREVFRNIRDRAYQEAPDVSEIIIDNFYRANEHWGKRNIPEGWNEIVRFIETMRDTLSDPVVASMIENQVDTFGYTLTPDVVYDAGQAQDYISSMASLFGGEFADSYSDFVAEE